MIRRVSSFRAIGSREAVRTVNVYEVMEWPVQSAWSGRSCTTLRTVFGQQVMRLEKGRYEVVETGERLVSDDPAAP